jgi:hypothetical protein
MSFYWREQVLRAVDQLKGLLVLQKEVSEQTSL